MKEVSAINLTDILKKRIEDKSVLVSINQCFRSKRN